MTFEGLVLRSTGSWYVVLSDDARIYECRLRGQYRIRGIRTTNPVAVGDRVSFEVEEDGNKGVIIEIHDRVNFIIRKSTKLSKSSHIIAANLDLAVLVATIDQPRTSTGFIDRFLVTAEAYHIPAAVVFNKLDLYNAKQMKMLDEVMSVYTKIGYPCLSVSAKTELNLEHFSALLKDKIALISGHSGVGKSALINAVNPGFAIRTGEISTVHNKGKHTTTFAEMHPLAFGGWIVDTPGIKEFGLYEFEKETLAQRFPEMRRRMNACRFTNCTHLHEPGCAIKLAVENNEIAGFRYKNYLNMIQNDFTNDN
ncbi:MAG: ribosome small subunit-dependent GTPase A [Bacteroidales bacterium]|nr:ribosome small subunit-dependent GTPase A [Bacteroidales bacterium]